MNDWQSPALVLTVRSHSESDKIVSLYSQDHGRLTAIAKGAQKSKKRFVNKLEPFTLLTVTCRSPKRGTLHFLHNAELVDANLGLRKDYRLYVTAIFICELLRLFSGTQDPDRKMFHLARSVLTMLAQKQCRADMLATFFLLHLLEICGYSPDLNTCSRCGKNIDQERDFILSPAGGCLICRSCHPGPLTSPLRLSRQTLKFLLSGCSMALTRLDNLRMSSRNTSQAITVLGNYCRHILQQDIHSMQSLLKMIETAG